MIADIGGGIGTQLVSILDASSSSKGILFDQPHLGPDSLFHNRMEVIGGNFFESVPMGRMLTCCAGFFMIGLSRKRRRSLDVCAGL